MNFVTLFNQFQKRGQFQQIQNGNYKILYLIQLNEQYLIFFQKEKRLTYICKIEKIQMTINL